MDKKLLSFVLREERKGLDGIKDEPLLMNASLLALYDEIP